MGAGTNNFDSPQQKNTKRLRWYLITKRLMDIFLSFIGLIILIPLFLVVAAAIKLEDPKGSIFFTQIRYGKYPKTFRMIKFRSMLHNAEEMQDSLKDFNEMDGPVFKVKDDPRITKVGKYIRRTSIDELPQLLNVLKGDMSLVGPRPPLLREVAQYTPYQLQRLSVKPGITCYWQVYGRNSIGFSEWVEMDIQYIRERNTWIDIKLILLSLPRLLGDKNAR